MIERQHPVHLSPVDAGMESVQRIICGGYYRSGIRDCVHFSARTSNDLRKDR